MSACRPELVTSHAPTWAAVGAAKLLRNHSAVAAENRSSTALSTGVSVIPPSLSPRTDITFPHWASRLNLGREHRPPEVQGSRPGRERECAVVPGVSAGRRVGAYGDGQWGPTVRPCSACSQALPDGARFCLSCGAPQTR